MEGGEKVAMEAGKMEGGEKMAMGDHKDGEMHMDEHHGFMVAQEPSSEPTIIEFTVPEGKVGTWEIACFEDDGDHYNDGMKATLVVTG